MQTLFTRTALALMHQNMKLTFILCSSETLSRTLSSPETSHLNREHSFIDTTKTVVKSTNDNCSSNNSDVDENNVVSTSSIVHKTGVSASAQRGNINISDNTNNDISKVKQERKYNETLSYSPHRLVKQFHRYNPTLLNKLQESSHRFKHSKSENDNFSPMRKDEFDKTLKKLKRYGFNALVWWCAIHERLKTATLQSDLKDGARALKQVKVETPNKRESENKCEFSEKELENVNLTAVTWVQNISKYLSCGQCLVIIGLLCDVWCNSVHVLHCTNQHFNETDKRVWSSEGEMYHKDKKNVGGADQSNALGINNNNAKSSGGISRYSGINVSDESNDYDIFSSDDEEEKKCDKSVNGKASYGSSSRLVNSYSALSTDGSKMTNKAILNYHSELNAQCLFQNEIYNECASTFFASTASSTQCAKNERITETNTKNNKVNNNHKKTKNNDEPNMIDTLDLTDVCDNVNSCYNSNSSTELFHQNLCNTIVTLIERALASKELEHQPLPVLVSALYGLHRVQSNTHISLSPMAKNQLQLHPAFFFTVLHHLRQEQPLKQLVQSNPSLALEVMITIFLLMNDEHKRVLLSSADDLVFCNLYEQTMTLLERKLSEKTKTNILNAISRQEYVKCLPLRNTELSPRVQMEECEHRSMECSEKESQQEEKNDHQNELLKQWLEHEQTTAVNSSIMWGSVHHQDSNTCTSESRTSPERRLNIKECLEIMRNVQCSPLLLRLLLAQYLLSELRSPESFSDEEVKYLPKLFSKIFTQPHVPFHVESSSVANNKFTQSCNHNVNNSSSTSGSSYRLIEYSNNNLLNLIHACRCLCTNIVYNARINDVVLRAALLIYCVNMKEYIKHERLHELLHLHLPQRTAIKLFNVCGKYLPWQIQNHVLECAFPNIVKSQVTQVTREKNNNTASTPIKQETAASDEKEIKNDIDNIIGNDNVDIKKSNKSIVNAEEDWIISQSNVLVKDMNKEQEEQQEHEQLMQLNEPVLCILEILCNQMETRFKESNSPDDYKHINIHSNVVSSDIYYVVERVVQCIDWNAGFVYENNVVSESAAKASHNSNFTSRSDNSNSSAESEMEYDVSSRSAALRALHLCMRLQEMFVTFPVMTDNHLLNNYVRRVLQDEATGLTVVLTELLKVVSLLTEREHQVELLKRIISYNGMSTLSLVEHFLQYIAPVAVQYKVKNDEVLNLLLRQRIVKPRKLILSFSNTPQSSFLACYTHRLTSALDFLRVNVESTNKLQVRNMNEVVYVWLDHYSTSLQGFMSSVKSATAQKAQHCFQGERQQQEEKQEQRTQMLNTNTRKQESTLQVSTCDNENHDSNESLDCVGEDSTSANSALQSLKKNNNDNENTTTRITEGKEKMSGTNKGINVEECKEQFDNTSKEEEKVITVDNNNTNESNNDSTKNDKDNIAPIAFAAQRLYECVEEEKLEALFTAVLRLDAKFPHRLLRTADLLVQVKFIMWKEKMKQLWEQEQQELLESLQKVELMHNGVTNKDEENEHKTKHAHNQWLTHLPLPAHFVFCERYNNYGEVFLPMKYVEELLRRCNLHIYHFLVHSIMQVVRSHANAPVKKRIVEVMHIFTLCLSVLKARYVTSSVTSNTHNSSVYSLLVCHLMKVFINYLQNDSAIASLYVKVQKYIEHDGTSHDNWENSELPDSNVSSVTAAQNDVSKRVESSEADLTRVNHKAPLANVEISKNNSINIENVIGLENDELEHDVPEYLEGKEEHETDNKNGDHGVDAEESSLLLEQEENSLRDDEEENNQQYSYEKLELVEREEYLESAKEMQEEQQEESNTSQSSRKNESALKPKSHDDNKINGSLFRMNISHLHNMYTRMEELMYETSSYLTTNDKRDVTLDLLDRLAVFFPRVAELLFASLEPEVALLGEPELIRLARIYPASTPQVVEILSHRDLKDKIEFSSFITLIKVLPMPINEVIINTFLPTMEFAWCTRLLSALSVRQVDVPNSLLRRILKRLRIVAHEAKDMERLSVIPVIQQFKPNINAAMLAKMKKIKVASSNHASMVDTDTTVKGKYEEDGVEGVLKRLSAIHYTVNRLLMIDEVLDIVKLRTFLSANGSVLERSMQAALSCQVDKMLHKLLSSSNVDVCMIHDILTTLNEHHMLFYHTTHYIYTCLFNDYSSTSHNVDVNIKNNNHGNANEKYCELNNKEQSVKANRSSKNNNRSTETLCYSNLLITYVRLAILISDANTKYDVTQRVSKQIPVPLSMYSLTQRSPDLAIRVKEDSLHALQWLMAQSPPHNELSHQLNMLTLLVEHYASDLVNLPIKLHNSCNEQHNCVSHASGNSSITLSNYRNGEERNEKGEVGIEELSKGQISVRHFVLQSIVRKLCQSLLHHCHLMPPNDVAKFVYNLSKLKLLREVLCNTSTSSNDSIAASTSSTKYSDSNNKVNETRQSNSNSKNNVIKRELSLSDAVCAAYDRADAYSRCVFIKAMNTDELVFAEYEEFIMSRICADLPVLSVDHVELVLIAALHMQHQEIVESLLDAIGTRLQSALTQCKRSTLIRLLQCHARHSISDDVLLKQVIETLSEQCTYEVKLNLIQIITFLEACVALQLHVPDRLLTVCFSKLEHSLHGASSQLQARTGQLLMDLEMGFTSNTHNIIRHIFDNRESLRGNAQLRQVVESLCRTYDVFIPSTVRAIKLRRHVHDERVSNYWHRRQSVDKAINLLDSIETKSTVEE